MDIIPTKNWDEKNGFSFPYSAIENIKKIYDEHGYDFIKIQTKKLNFEQPENFVKLFNLQVEQVEDNQTKPTVSGFISDYHWFNDTNGFLEMLISELKENDEYNTIENQWRDSIKQSIRDYDGWVWG